MPPDKSVFLLHLLWISQLVNVDLMFGLFLCCGSAVGSCSGCKLPKSYQLMKIKFLQ